MTALQAYLLGVFTPIAIFAALWALVAQNGAYKRDGE